MYNYDTCYGKQNNTFRFAYGFALEIYALSVCTTRFTSFDPSGPVHLRLQSLDCHHTSESQMKNEVSSFFLGEGYGVEKWRMFFFRCADKKGANNKTHTLEDLVADMNSIWVGICWGIYVATTERFALV